MQNKKLKDDFNLITILGPTASGKTVLAASVAYELDGEIISGDSRQIYKKMDLGTGKDLCDYIVNNKAINYHLIDIREPGYKYNLFEFQKDFFEAYKKIIASQKIPILCGGSGLYIESIIDNYNILEVPENMELRESLNQKSKEELESMLISLKDVHNKTEFDTKKRTIRAIEIEIFYKDSPIKRTSFPKINSIVFGVKYDREEQRARVTTRLKQRLDDGMIAEVQDLLNSGIKAENMIYYGLEYKYVTLYLLGEISYEKMFELLNIAIHQFQKRQMTWFRKMEREGTNIIWIDGHLDIQSKTKIICSY